MGGFNIDIFTVTVKADKTERLCCLFHLTLANRPLSFQHAKASETGLGDFHKLSTFFKCQYSRLKLKVIHYRNCKKLECGQLLRLKKVWSLYFHRQPQQELPSPFGNNLWDCRKTRCFKKENFEGSSCAFY